MMTDDTVTAAIAACLPDGAGFDCGALEDRQGALFDPEDAEITRAVAARAMGFRAGRTCARAALRAIGIADGPIPAAADRRPLWPDGALGSITHSDRLAAAIAGRSARFIGLGIDLEPATALAPHLADAICRPEERDIVVPGLDTAKLVFVIKEAFYKAYYPATLQFLDFADARVSLEPGTDAFTVSLTNPDHPAIAGRRAIPGRWGKAADHFVAIAALRRA